jgi:AAA15 family ATPase/GTPase
MILEFKVKNFLSFKEEQVLSLEANSDKYLQDYHCINVNPDIKVLKLCMIYGANASGKSNLLLALDFLRIKCIETKDRSEKTGFIPFSFDNTSKQEPGFFEISFFANNHKYIYSLCLDKDLIIDEKLTYYPGQQPALIFQRQHQKKDDEYILKTGSKIKVSPVEMSVLKSNTLNNMTIISGLSKTNIKFPELKAAYDWFLNILKEIIKPSNDIFRETVLNLMEQPFDFKKFIFKGLEKADFNITDIYIEPDHIPLNSFDTPNIVSDINTVTYYNKNKVFFIHQTKCGDKDSIEKLDARYQSAGTLKYFGLLGIIKMAIDKNMVLNFDELENSLHPELINHLINYYLYHSKLVSSHSQFIFTTHNVDLLAEDFIRKDIVWFTDKQSDGATNLYSLSDFDIRKNLSFVNAYKAGKFGAIPNIGII